MIKVLHIVSSLYKNSGVMSVIMNYYRYIDINRVQFYFLCFKDPQLGENYCEEIELLGGNYIYIDSKNYVELIKNIRQYIKDTNNQYAFFQNHEVYLTCLIQFFNINSNKFITYSHSTQYSDYTLSSYRNSILCIPIRYKNYIRCACSNDAGIHLYKNKSFVVFNNAIDIEKFHFNHEERKKAREKHGLNINNKVVGNIGRLSRQKNQIFLLEVMNEIIKQDDSFILLLIGEGSSYNEIMDYILKHNMQENVIYINNTNEIKYYLNMMDLFVMTSIYEGLPVVGVEAQCNGLRCVMSDNITKDINITDVSFLKLNDSITKWTDEIVNKSSLGRVENIKLAINEKKFDIKEEAKMIVDFYIDKNSQLYMEGTK